VWTAGVVIGVFQIFAAHTTAGRLYMIASTVFCVWLVVILVRWWREPIE
jgi:hypothetical protein